MRAFLAAGLISSDRASNRADIAYLFYLPFCHLFVSGDKLHRRCSPFLTKAQDFVWGPDLKAALTSINQSLSTLPEAERQKGLHKIAPKPPGDTNNLVVSLWEKHTPTSGRSSRLDIPLDPAAERKMVQELKAFCDSPTAPEAATISSDSLESVAIERRVAPKRGSWWVIPKAVADKEREHKMRFDCL